MKPLRDLGNEYCAWDALVQICLESNPRSYLEVGTRYGDSLLRVVAATDRQLDRIVIADTWGIDYMGEHQYRSHEHIRRMLEGFGLTAEYLDGDSARTIPTLTGQFDLVLVDGDHSREAARTDLWNCWKLVAPGGHLVFDDITSEQYLAELWTEFKNSALDLAESQVRMDKKFGVAVGVKYKESLETSKVREHVLGMFPSYFGAPSAKGIDIGCSRDPLTPTCVAFDRPEFTYPEINSHGDARALPFPDEWFDWVWSSHCLEDFAETYSVLHEWVRVLKPGGVIGLYVPHPELYAKYGAGNTDHKVPGFTPEYLKTLLERENCFVVASMIDDDVSVKEHPHYSTLVVARKR